MKEINFKENQFQRKKGPKKCFFSTFLTAFDVYRTFLDSLTLTQNRHTYSNKLKLSLCSKRSIFWILTNCPNQSYTGHPSHNDHLAQNCSPCFDSFERSCHKRAANYLWTQDASSKQQQQYDHHVSYTYYIIYENMQIDYAFQS